MYVHINIQKYNMAWMDGWMRDASAMLMRKCIVRRKSSRWIVNSGRRKIAMQDEKNAMRTMNATTDRPRPNAGTTEKRGPPNEKVLHANNEQSNCKMRREAIKAVVTCRASFPSRKATGNT